MPEQNQVLTIQKPASGTQAYQLTEEKEVKFAFPADAGSFDVEGQNLTFTFESGEKVVLENFYDKFNKDNLQDLPRLSMDDIPSVDGQAFLSALGENFVPAGGPGGGAATRGARYNDYGNLDLLDGINHLRELDWGMQTGVELTEDPETLGVLDDDEGGREGATPPPHITVTIDLDPIVTRTRLKSVLSMTRLLARTRKPRAPRSLPSP